MRDKKTPFDRIDLRATFIDGKCYVIAIGKVNAGNRAFSLGIMATG